MKRPRTAEATLLMLTALAAYGLKRHYSVASAEELAWILRPTAALVSAVTGHEFAGERHAGFVSRELSFVIAPSCAGVNFVIIALCMLMVSFVGAYRTWQGKMAHSFVSVVVAYLAAILVNALRIILAIGMRNRDDIPAWLSPSQLHRVEGVIVYVACLYALFFVAQRLVPKGLAR